MPFTYFIDESEALATIVWTGEITLPEAADCIGATLRDPRYRPGFRRLVDMRSAAFVMPKAQNRELATIQGPRGILATDDRGRVALLVGDDLSYAVANQYAAYAELQGIPTEVFRDIKLAQRWLRANPAEDTRLPHISNSK